MKGEGEEVEEEEEMSEKCKECINWGEKGELFPTFQTLPTVSNSDSQCECLSLQRVKLATLQIQGADGGKEDNPVEKIQCIFIHTGRYTLAVPGEHVSPNCFLTVMAREG